MNCGIGIAVAVVEASSYSSYLTATLGASICCETVSAALKSEKKKKKKRIAAWTYKDLYKYVLPISIISEEELNSKAINSCLWEECLIAEGRIITDFMFLLNRGRMS